MTLPSAYLEEVVCPEHVVVTVDDDGTVHLLCYMGEHLPDKFVALKHVVLAGRHASIVDRVRLESDLEVEEELEEENEDELEEVEPCDVCGEPLLESGWCPIGHVPRDQRLESLGGVRS